MADGVDALPANDAPPPYWRDRRCRIGRTGRGGWEMATSARRMVVTSRCLEVSARDCPRGATRANLFSTHYTALRCARATTTTDSGHRLNFEGGRAESPHLGPTAAERRHASHKCASISTVHLPLQGADAPLCPGCRGPGQRESAACGDPVLRDPPLRLRGVAVRRGPYADT